MSDLRITAGPLEFGADWVEAAPKTCAAFAAMLPFRNKIIHVRWSGESAWIPLGDMQTNLDFENHTSHPAPGEILLYPGGYSETEILFPYGGTCFASIVGQLAGNHFLTVTEGADQLRELGRLVLWEGAQDVVFDEHLSYLPTRGCALRSTCRLRRHYSAAQLEGEVSSMRRVALALGAAFVLALAGCGGDDEEEPADAGQRPQQEAKQGGDLSVLYAADVDKIDPGTTYYQYGMNVAYATQRPLYSFKPDDAINPEPDLAEGPPEIAEDGKTVTVKIRTGVKFSPPVNREVTSADVAYGLERGFTHAGGGPLRGRLHGRPQGPEGVPGRRRGRRSRASRPPTTRRSCSSSTLRAARSSPARWRCPPRRRCRATTRRRSTARTPSAYGQQPGGHRPVHGRERRVGQASPATRRAPRSSSSATPTGTRRPTTSRPTWTRSRSRRATTPTSRRARSSRATRRCPATSSCRRRSSRASRRATRRT